MSSLKGCQSGYILKVCLFIIIVLVMFGLIPDIFFHLIQFKPHCGNRIPACPHSFTIEIPFPPTKLLSSLQEGTMSIPAIGQTLYSHTGQTSGLPIELEIPAVGKRGECHFSLRLATTRRWGPCFIPPHRCVVDFGHLAHTFPAGAASPRRPYRVFNFQRSISVKNQQESIASAMNLDFSV